MASILGAADAALHSKCKNRDGGKSLVNLKRNQKIGEPCTPCLDDNIVHYLPTTMMIIVHALPFVQPIFCRLGGNLDCKSNAETNFDLHDLIDIEWSMADHSCSMACRYEKTQFMYRRPRFEALKVSTNHKSIS